MPTLLKNINVQYISLVKSGANKKEVIFKSAENPPQAWETKILKTDEDKQMVYGVVYSPDEVDSHGDYSTAEEIEKASYAFMKNLNGLNVDKQHSFKSEDAYVAESWILKDKDPVFKSDKKGSWAVGIKVESKDLWKSVKDGEIKGLSMAGTADKIEKSDDKDEEKSFKAFFKNFFKDKEKEKDKMPDFTKEDLKKFLEEGLKKAKDDGDKDVPAMIKKEIDEFKEKVANDIVKPLLKRIEEIEKATKGSLQDDNEFEKASDQGAKDLLADAEERAGINKKGDK